MSRFPYTPFGAAVVASVSLACALPAGAQWASHPSPSVPRAADGTPDLAGPAPRASDGRPDLSGIWEIDEVRHGTAQLGPRLRSPFFSSVTGRGDQAVWQPWAEAERARRREANLTEDPVARCMPAGMPVLKTYPLPFKVVQTPSLVVLLYEKNMDFRQVFLDGRTLPDSPQPTFLGYSVGRWDGDALVVESAGFNNRTWLDANGAPHTDALRVTERYTRLDAGRMDVEITLDDPGALQKPVTFRQFYRLMPDSELIEYFCVENEKSVQHFRP